MFKHQCWRSAEVNTADHTALCTLKSDGYHGVVLDYKLRYSFSYATISLWKDLNMLCKSHGFASKQEVLEKKTTNVFLPYICRSVYCSHFRGLEPHPRLFANETTNLLENTVKQRRDAIWREDSANICSELEKCSIPLASTASSFRNCWLAIVTLPNIVVLFPWQRSGPANTWWSVSSFLNLSKKSFRVTYLLTTSVLEFITTLVTVIDVTSLP